jgi:hypothetical protein
MSFVFPKAILLNSVIFSCHKDSFLLSFLWHHQIHSMSSILPFLDDSAQHMKKKINEQCHWTSPFSLPSVAIPFPCFLFSQTFSHKCPFIFSLSGDTKLIYTTGESEISSVSFTDRLYKFQRSQHTLSLPISISQHHACAGPIISQWKLAIFTQQRCYLLTYRLKSETIHFPCKI